LLSLLCFVALVAGRSAWGDEAWRVSTKNCQLGFHSGDGAIEYFGRPGGGESIFHSGPAGLWEATLADGRTIRAADFATPPRSVVCRPEAGGRRARLEFRSAELDVTVTAEAGENRVDLWADLVPHAGPVLSFGLPGRLEFSPQRLVRLVTPASGNESVGYGLRSGFFQEHPRKQPGKRGYYEYRSLYPPAFADFFHWDTEQGSAAVYRVAPRTWEPWQATKDPKAIFVPGRIAVGGSKAGGWCERPFVVHLAVGHTWRSPKVRLTLGAAAGENLAAYCRDNHIQRRLEQKMSADTLEKFKQAVLVLYWGDCQQKRAHLDKLPRPTLVHFADYLHGGFDKQYPDHLPPAASFGTADELRAFLRDTQRLGHLSMPYTNPTWWCDGPRGPTFVEHGEGPLLRLLDGRLSHERYSKNEGFTVCHWHPAVQAANRKTMTQFSEEFPVDVVFQDQCGARGWRYDLNPASPTPYAYTEGLLSMVAEDARRKPLSTESGWDGVVNDESQLCGMTWNIVPTEGKPEWVRTMRQSFDPATWEVFPVAQYIAHDKTAMVHHDLGQFVTNAEVMSWTLGLGFAMSARGSAEGFAREPARHWLLWLDRLQKSVCARYVGQPVVRFEHDRRGQTADDGVIRAVYGDVQIVANLGPHPVREDGRELAEYGFLCTAPGMVAAHLRSLGGRDFGAQGISFVSQEKPGGADVWVYAAPEQHVAALVPGLRSASAAVTCDGSPAVDAAIRDGVCAFRLPALPDQKRIEPPSELARAPRDWPGPRPAVGVVDFGPRIGSGWTRIAPREWLDAFRQSRLAKEFGVPVRAIQTPAELAAALGAGPRAWLAIVNPYGESFPSVGTGRATLAAIRGYVNHGGCWWETGGYSLYTAVRLEGDQAQREALGPGGMESLGLSVGHGAVEQRAEALAATPTGRQWLAAELVERIDRSQGIVNRALPRGAIDAAHLTLVTGGPQDYIGGYRLEGWGWLWRVGGFWPDRELVLPVAVGAMEYVYTHAPQPVEIGGARRVWHAGVQGR
jgi:hypothetical protein